MDYLAIHIDVDFLVGTICTDENCHLYPIKDESDDFLWLYFYNDPYQNIVSFGKENQKHYGNGEINYYGGFIELIEDVNNTFSIGEYQYPIIELLRYSKLLDKLKRTYAEKMHSSTENIPTLVTFSLSVNALARQKLVEYFELQGFNILSYTIPLSELACFYVKNNNNVNICDGNIVAFLEASNSDLHLMKLMYSENYFLLDGEPETKQGLGIDPRKRALLKYVVNKIGTMGMLKEQEKEVEYKILEPKADEWLHKMDLQSNNCPVDVNEALSKMPNAKRRVLLYKDKIAEFTSSDIQLILDNYTDYVNRNVEQGVTAVILFGDCFQNDAIRIKIENLIGADKIYFYANKDIHDILAMYPKIDITRYACEESRIKERAKAEELKQAEQRALEDRKRKEQEAEAEKAVAELKAAENRKEAKKIFELAVKLEKDGKLQDALTNVMTAIEKDKENIEYKRLKSSISEKLNELKIQTDQYKLLLKKAEKSIQSKDYESALNIYEIAEELFDNAVNRKVILEVKEKIKQQNNLKERLKKLFDKAELLYTQSKLIEAKDVFSQILQIESKHKEAKARYREIDKILKENEGQYKDFVLKADTNLKKLKYNAATSYYREALKIRPDDEYCLNQLKVAAEKKERVKPVPPPPPPKKKPVSPPPPPKKKSKATNGVTAIKNVSPPPPINAAKQKKPDRRASAEPKLK